MNIMVQYQVLHMNIITSIQHTAPAKTILSSFMNVSNILFMPYFLMMGCFDTANN